MRATMWMGLATAMASALTSGLTIEDVQAWPDILQAVTGDEIIAAAQRSDTTGNIGHRLADAR